MSGEQGRTIRFMLNDRPVVARVAVYETVVVTAGVLVYPRIAELLHGRDHEAAWQAVIRTLGWLLPATAGLGAQHAARLALVLAGDHHHGVVLADVHSLAHEYLDRASPISK